MRRNWVTNKPFHTGVGLPESDDAGHLSATAVSPFSPPHIISTRVASATTTKRTALAIVIPSDVNYPCTGLDTE